MRVERLDCPRGSVVVFKNKSAHAVEPKPVDSVTTRWNFGTVITNRLQAMLFVCVFTSMSAGVEERRPHEPPRLDDASLGAEAGARQRRGAHATGHRARRRSPRCRRLRGAGLHQHNARAEAEACRRRQQAVTSLENV